RPLAARMLAYAINDTHYLLPLADRLESELRERDRFDWLRQSCQSAIEQRRWNGFATTMNFGVFGALAQCVALRRQSCARFVNGERKKRKRQTDRHFIFCKITSC